MRLREEDQMDPQVERELAAIDAALRGEAVESDLADLAELSADIAELRPNPEESFAARMDRKVAAGFGPASVARACSASRRRGTVFDPFR